MKSKIFIAVCVIFIIYLFQLKFEQYSNIPVSGDFAEVVMPSTGKGYYDVLKDPFGLRVLFENKNYANPNRYFAHAPIAFYFKNVPLWLQGFVTPVQSLYLSIALASVIILLFCVLILIQYIKVSTSWKKEYFFPLFAFLLVFFQVHGYYNSMAVIDVSVIYTFCYALPLLYVLIYLYPFFRLWMHPEKSISKIEHLLLLIMAPLITLNGPLNPGILLVVVALFGCAIFLKEYQSTTNLIGSFKNIFSQKYTAVFIHFVCIVVCAFYSLGLAKNNALNISNDLDLWSRFLVLPKGLLQILTQKPAYLWIALFMIVSSMLLHKISPTEEKTKARKLLQFIGLFALLYLLMLPFGGYRPYRPYIIRYDTFMPVTMVLIFYMGWLLITVWNNFNSSNKQKVWGISKYYYVVFAVLIVFVFYNADRKIHDLGSCERAQLEKLYISPEEEVVLEKKCVVMDWEGSYDASIVDLNTTYFQHIGILKKEQKYRFQ